MRTHGTDHRPTAQFDHLRNLRLESVILIAFLLLALPWQSARAQQTDTSTSVADAPLTAEQVIQHLVYMNRERAQALLAYQGTRTYRIGYQGFAGSRNAEMVVVVKYASPSTKEFSIQSSTGSKMIIDKVFKKLLEAEKDALDADVQRRTAISEENYSFTLVQCENEISGLTYVLELEPRRRDKYLFRGRIWVDAVDFALMRVEAQPAKNPSFWTTKAEIVQVYRKVSDFWLPAYNHSITAIRLGGNAELTIDYTDYEITGASRVSSLSASPTAPPIETVRSRY